MAVARQLYYIVYFLLTLMYCVFVYKLSSRPKYICLFACHFRLGSTVTNLACLNNCVALFLSTINQLLCLHMSAYTTLDCSTILNTEVFP